MYVSIDLLGPKQTILSFAHKLSNYLVDPYECYLGFVILDNMKKTGQKNFFSKPCVFNDLLCPEK